jgi:hypothetical protein
MTSAYRHASQPALTFCEAFVCRSLGYGHSPGWRNHRPSRADDKRVRPLESWTMVYLDNRRNSSVACRRKPSVRPSALPRSDQSVTLTEAEFSCVRAAAISECIGVAFDPSSVHKDDLTPHLVSAATHSRIQRCAGVNVGCRKGRIASSIMLPEN